MKDLKEQIKKEDEELEKIEKKVKSELKDCAEEILDKNHPYDKDKSIMKQIILSLAGIFYWLMGFALYYIFKDKKEAKWEADILLKASAVGLALDIIVTILEIVPTIVEKFS